MKDTKWLTFYTKSRHEEKVRDLLLKKGYPVFLPMQQVIKQWSDRKKKIKVPLFSSYIFVNEIEQQIPLIVQTPGIAWSVKYNNKPAVLHYKEYEMINKFLETGLFIETVPVNDFQEGDFVEVAEGQLKGVKGRLVQTSEGNKFGVTLSVLGNSMLIKLDARLLKKAMIFNE